MKRNDDDVNMAIRMLQYTIKYNCNIHVKQSPELTKIFDKYVGNLDETAYTTENVSEIEKKYGKMISSDIVFERGVNCLNVKIKRYYNGELSEIPSSSEVDNVSTKYIFYLPFIPNINKDVFQSIILDIIEAKLQFLLCVENMKTGEVTKSFCNMLFAKPFTFKK